MDLYSKNDPINPFVEVRAGINIADKDGVDALQIRLFAKQDLPAGQKVIIYSGEISSERPHEGRYVMEVNGKYIDAEHDMHDVGYIDRSQSR